jgi:hypothetical protein
MRLFLALAALTLYPESEQKNLLTKSTARQRR